MANGKVESPPYVPWSRLDRFLQGFKEHGVPPRIDGSLMTGMSGTDQSLVRGALRFFGLVSGENDATTPYATTVVEALGTEGWPSVAAGMVEKYAGIVTGVDFSTGTQAQLEAAFREHGGVNGSVLAKAVRLYLTLRDEAKLPSSPYFKGRAKLTGNGTAGPVPRPRKTRKAKTGAGGGSLTVEGAPPGQVPEGTDVVQFSIPGGKLVRMWLPNGLSQTELGFVTRYLKDYLKVYGEKT